MTTTEIAAPRSVGNLAVATLSYLVPAIVLSIVVVLCLFMLNTPAGVFRSPDENAEFLFTGAVSENSLPFYEDEGLALDEENLLHPRGALTHEGRTVPVGYLGLPVLYGTIQKVVGSDVRYIIIPLAVITVAAIAGTGSMLAAERPWLAWLAVLALAPVLFYLTRPFVNATPAFALTSVGLFFFVRYFRTITADAGRDFLLGAVFLALASFVRYELAIFATLFVLILLLHRHQGELRLVAKQMALFVAVMATVFVGPVLVLNYLTYGHPAQFGYSLFNEAYFPERWSSGTGLIEDLFRVVRGILLPAYPVESGLASRSLLFQVLGVAPVLAVLAVAGLAVLLGRKDVPVRYVLHYGALGFYIFFYRGAGESWLAGTTTPSLEASIVRYSLPLYLGLYCLVVYALSRVARPEIATAAVVFAAMVGLYGAVWHTEGNLSHIKNQLIASEQLVESRILPNTETNSLIYTDVFDKMVSSRRDVATWWGSADKSEASIFQPKEIADSIARHFPQRPVYLFIADVDFFLPQIEAALEQRGLAANETPAPRLYRVVSIDTVAWGLHSR